MNAATNQPSILTLRLGQSDQAGQRHWENVACENDFRISGRRHLI